MKVIFFVLMVSTCLFGQTTINETLSYDGLERTFIVYLPANHTRSVVLAFHGHTTVAKPGRDMMLGYGLMAKADTDGTIIVSVDGYPSDGSHWPLGARGWNAYHCCGSSFENQIDDVGFVSYLIDYLKYTYGVDQVAALGFSNGGMLCHRLASELSDKISAIADVSGCIGGQTTAITEVRSPLPPANKVSVVMVHGRKDPYVPYSENWLTTTDERWDIPFEDGVRFWRQAGGYDVERSANIKATPDCEIKSYTSVQSESIADRHGMMTIVFPNGEHECPAWPFVLDTIWKFFKNHAR